MFIGADIAMSLGGGEMTPVNSAEHKGVEEDLGIAWRNLEVQAVFDA